MERIILLPILAILIFVSCTNVSFQEYYGGPKGIDYRKGSCLVNELDAKISKEATVKFTSIILGRLQEVWGDSVALMASLQSNDSLRELIPAAGRPGLIDSLRKHTRYLYLLEIKMRGGDTGGGIQVGTASTEYSDVDLGETVRVEITEWDIQTKEKIYFQRVKASEFVDEENESPITFSRSSENIMKKWSGPRT